MNKKHLELLSPALNYETAIQAILHGADAVYIGASSHGARKAASNSVEDIERVVDFAHQYRAKVYVTLNTLIFDDEIAQVKNLCNDLYKVGVDALIVQDMGLLRMNLPPIALHASTQCDIRTPEKAKFLEEVGFSQLVLARELTLDEIKEICSAVTIPVETFIHGALCVSYSGRCHASLALSGRSANRGECAQICRLPFTLTDADGKILEKDKYLLSLKDLNIFPDLKELINAGVRSFKIEGRLKDLSYVKNITALYNTQLNQIIEKSPDDLIRSSYGRVSLKFEPKADKSFNRGFTNYFINNRKPLKISSLDTPKSKGEKINKLSELNNGDGISFFDQSGKFTGVNINRVEGNRLITARKVIIPSKSPIFRTFDVKWEKELNGPTAERKLWLDINFENDNIIAIDERGIKVLLPLEFNYQQALKKQDYRNVFEKLGGTIYYLRNYYDKNISERFYRVSDLTSLKRNLIEHLQNSNKDSYTRDFRRIENLEAMYPNKDVDYRENISNFLAKEFYIQHGVNNYELAAEVTRNLKKDDVLMTTRHCVLRELGKCLKEKGNRTNFRLPLYLNDDRRKLRLDFDCKNCEMKVRL